MAYAAQFATRMTQIGVQIEKKTTKKVNELALAIQRDLVTTTPVDTGQAISNWTLTLSDPSNDFEPPYAPGDHGTTRQLNIGAAYNQAMFAVADRRPGQPIWISNNAPYIVELNQGSSRQAPAGFVQTAVMKAIRSISSIKVLK